MWCKKKVEPAEPVEPPKPAFKIVGGEPTITPIFSMYGNEITGEFVKVAGIWEWRITSYRKFKQDHLYAIADKLNQLNNS